jgi:hypothetical protein
MLPTTCWQQKLGRDCQEVNRQCKRFSSELCSVKVMLATKLFIDHLVMHSNAE